MLNISDKQEQEHVPQELESRALFALSTLPTSRSAKVLRNWILILLGILIIGLFLPWQQNITGYGKITALNPADRPQTIQSIIPGRISGWYVQEGQFVRKGDTILTLTEVKDDYFDPQLGTRLQEQKVAKEQSIAATERQIVATGKQLEALRNALTFSLQKARNKVKQARLKLIADSTDLRAAEIDYQIATVQLDRFQKLFDEKGLISLTDLERRKLKAQETYAKKISLENKFLVAKNELLNALVELNSLTAEYTDKISKTEGELANKESYLADARSDYSKLVNKISNVNIRIGNYAVTAPQDAFIVRASKTGIGETVKEGDPLVTIQPDVPSLAAEVYVRAMDVPLIQVGRVVRLEFDGWPALQFSGWPSVAVGTFAGEVYSVDQVNMSDGTFRVLVKPVKEDRDWPIQLRLGSGAYGWIMLDDVPVWYEIWRQLNGFPPSLKAEPEDEKSNAKKAKTK